MDDRTPRADARQGREYWNTRARRNAGDAARAAGLDDPVANACIDGVQRRILTHALARLAKRRSLQDATLLDLGCGSGRWIDTLRGAGCRYFGVDAAAAMLALARNDHRQASLIAADGARLPFADGSFDLIWSVAAVHHNPHEVQERILAEMVRVLNTRGAMVLFEGVGARDRSGAVYWPRPREDWMDVGRRLGLTCVWRRGARYMILAAALEKVLRIRRQESGGGSQDAAAKSWGDVLARLDVSLHPYLNSLLPARYHNRMAMIFDKTSEKTGIRG